jgi:hypothetical protein
MRRHPQRHRLQPRRDQRRQARIGPQRQHQRQRPRPERRRHRPRPVVEDGQRLGLGQPRQVHDQRVEAWPPLGLKDRGHRPVVGGIAAQAIDRLGRKGDQQPLAQQFGSAAHSGIVGRQHLGPVHLTQRPS